MKVTPEGLILLTERMGIRLTTDGENLCLVAPKRPDALWIDLLRAHKPALMATLARQGKVEPKPLR